MRASESAGGPAGSTSATIFAPDRSALRALTDRCRSFCYSAVRTIASLPDREWTWLNSIGSGAPAPVLSPAEVQREWGLDAGVTAEVDQKEERRRRAMRYRPGPDEVARCVDVLSWLTWLERERNGRTERKIICARAYEVSYASLAERFGRSDETIRRWEAAALMAIVGQFHAELEAMR